MHGYEAIPPVLPHTAMPPLPRVAARHPGPRPGDPRRGRPDRGRDRRARLAAVDRGMATWRRTARCWPARTRPTGRQIRSTNALSADHAVLRQGLLGSLLEVVESNLRQGRDDIAIFEIGKGYGYDSSGPTTHEWWRLGFALAGASRAGRLEPAGPSRGRSTTRRAWSSSSRPACGRPPRPGLRWPASPSTTQAEARSARAPASWPAGWASSTRPCWPSSTCARNGW